MSILIFQPWRFFVAEIDQRVIRRFLLSVADDGTKAFRDGVRSPKSGRYYHRVGGGHRASAPGEFPARDSGKHYSTIGSRVGGREVTIGSGQFYAKFLAEGTTRMAKRRMSREALNEGVKTSRHRLQGFAHWKR